MSNNIFRLKQFYQPLAIEFERKNNTKLNILFLCAGNTCRSATAGVIGKYIFENTANINSAGLRIRGSSGGPMKREAKRWFCNNFDCSYENTNSPHMSHKSKELTPHMVETAHYIFVMDKGLADTFLEEYGVINTTPYLLCDNVDVEDPWDSLHQPYLNQPPLQPRYVERGMPDSEKMGIYKRMLDQVYECVLNRLNQIFQPYLYIFQGSQLNNSNISNEFYAGKKRKNKAKKPTSSGSKKAKKAKKANKPIYRGSMKANKANKANKAKKPKKSNKPSSKGSKKAKKQKSRGSMKANKQKSKK